MLAAVSKFGIPCAFWVKVIAIDFQLEKYIPFKEKDVHAILTSQ